MSRMRLSTRLLKRAEAALSLGCSVRTFARRWDGVFTDSRTPAERKRGVERKVFEDELAEAVNAGGGERGIAAVTALRRTMRRL